MKLFTLLRALMLSCMIATYIHAQTYIDVISDTYKDDALVDMQYNITHLKPEGLFKLGSGFNVLTFDETNGSVLSSKFVIATGKTLTPVCVAQAGTQCFVFCEDANNVYYTSLNTATGVIAYTKSIPRFELNAYSELSAVDADYDGSSILHVALRCKGYSGVTWNAAYMKITVSTGAITGNVWGGETYDLVPNDIDYVDASHIYISGTGRTHTPTTNPMNFMLLNVTSVSVQRLFEIPLTNNRGRSMYVKPRNGYLYVMADSYHPSYIAAGPLVVARLTDNNNGTMTINNQYIYGGSTFFIHDVQEEYGVLIASGELPVFISGASSAPRNFLFNSLVNTAMMSQYVMNNNVNIRTVYSGISLRMFSVAKDNNMLYSMSDLRTDVNATTLVCDSTLQLNNPNESISITPKALAGKSVDPTETNVTTVDSYKTYTWVNTCNTRYGQPGSDPLHDPFFYPNPANDVLYVSHLEGVSHIRIYDAEGRMLINRVVEQGTSVVDIDLSSFAPGLYLFETEQNGQVNRSKLIKQ